MGLQFGPIHVDGADPVSSSLPARTSSSLDSPTRYRRDDVQIRPLQVRSVFQEQTDSLYVSFKIAVNLNMDLSEIVRSHVLASSPVAMLKQHFTSSAVAGHFDFLPNLNECNPRLPLIKLRHPF